MDPQKRNTAVSTPKKPKDHRPAGSRSSPTSPASPHTIEKILRLYPISFSFPRQPLFTTSHRATIQTALGAVNRRGRAGKQPIVMKRVTLLFRLAVQTHLFYPSFDLESKTFWMAVLSDVRDEEPFLAQELSAQAMAEVVGTYTQAYANGRGEGDNDEEDDSEGEEDDGFESAFELLTHSKRHVDPKTTLLSLVRVWAKLFRNHKANIATKRLTHERNRAATTNDTPSAPCPDQLPDESDAAYISRLKATMEELAVANKAAQDEINELKRSQKLADEYNATHNARLHATLDRMDAKLKQTERELRLERIGAGGGGEDDPWVPFRDYAHQLDGAF